MREYIRIIENANGITAYHGSRNGHGEFRLGHTGQNSMVFGPYESTRWGAFFTDNPEFAKQYGEVAEYRLNVADALDMDSHAGQHYVRAFIDSLDAFDPVERNIWITATHVIKARWQMFENEIGQRFTEFLRREGYAAATFEEYHEDDEGQEHKSQTIVVFDMSAITRVGILKEIYDADAGIFSDDLNWSSVAPYFKTNRGRMRLLGKARNGYRIVSVQPLDKTFEIYLLSPRTKPLAYLSGNYTQPGSGIWVVGGVMTDPALRQKGYAYLLYQWMLDQGVSLVSDDSQTPGGKAIWAKLFHDGYPMFIWGEDDWGDTPVRDIRAFYSARNGDRLLVRPRGSPLNESAGGHPLSLTVYHGSGQTFDRFEHGHANGMTRPRQGFYFTDDEAAAAEFGRVRAYRITLQRPADFTEGQGNPIVQEVLRANPGLATRLLAAVRERYGDSMEETRLAGRLGMMGLLQGPEFVETLERLGYDGMVIEDAFAGHVFTSYVVFDPANISPEGHPGV